MNFVVMRATETQEEGGRGVRRPEPQYFRRRSEYMKVGPNITGTVLVLSSYCPTRMSLFAHCNCTGCSFNNQASLASSAVERTPTFPGFGESRHLRHRVEMKAPVWSLPC